MPVYEIKYAPIAWRLLNGAFCLYKPSQLGYYNTRAALIMRLCRDLNGMDIRPPKKVVSIEGSHSTNDELSVSVKESFADHPLVVGERYQPKDFSVFLSNYPGRFCSGIVVGFIGRNVRLGYQFRKGMHLKVYEVKGKFGYSTDNFLITGNIIEKSRYRHVKEDHIVKVLSRIQALQQTLMFKTLGIDMRTDAAYQLASKGMIRPSEPKTSPVVYGLKCVDFNLPEFTVQIECINEFEPFLAGLIHEIALKLKTSAVCTSIRLIRLGPFTIEHALLDKHWTVENVINNIRTCDSLLKPHIIEPLSPIIRNISQDDDHESFLEMLKRKEYDDLNKPHPL